MRRLVIWSDGELGFWLRYHQQLPAIWCLNREAVCAIVDRLADQAPQY